MMMIFQLCFSCCEEVFSLNLVTIQAIDVFFEPKYAAIVSAICVSKK